ncbi:MAG: endonuclease/exonuclease/phosphatase family protein [Bacteroidetes bacterium]|nr:endonuclease/exonuclease/phosphatase family protein [Bacteroidota bacterium]
MPKPTDSLWFGHNLNKGLGVFSYSDFRFQVLDVYDDQLKMIVPIAVSNSRFSFTLFAIWANNPNDPDGQYVEQVWKALQRYDALIKNKRTILIGDFNSNTIWDRPRREGNHSAVVKKLAAKGVHSLYHYYFNQVQGSELHPTLYLYRKKERPYHLDYCFASNDFLKRLTKVEVGEFETWSAYSDHMPLIISFK